MFNWELYLNLAEELFDLSCERKRASTSSDEAMRRCAVSRAYYAAFWEATQFIKGKEKTFRYEPGQSHDSLISALKRYSESRDIGVQLHSLKGRRHKADYDPGDRTFTEAQTRLDLKVARDLVTKISNL